MKTGTAEQQKLFTKASHQESKPVYLHYTRSLPIWQQIYSIWKQITSLSAF